MSPANSTFDSESFVREAYATAERMDIEGWKSLFLDDGIFIDESVQRTYRGPHEWDCTPRSMAHPMRRSADHSRCRSSVAWSRLSATR